MPRADSEQRTKILQAALPVFAEHGRDGASIRMVAEAADVNSALLYYYFEDKHSLFVEAVRQVMRGFLDRLAEQDRPFASGHDRVAFLVNHIFDYYGTHPPRMRLMADAIISHPEVLGQVIRGFVQAKTLFPLQILHDGMARGEIKPASALQMWWSLLGACMFSLKMREVIPHANLAAAPFPVPAMEAARTEIIEMLSNGLAWPAKAKTSMRKRSR
jgi:TetR/AcrR family transcriptional regulator